MRSRKKLTICSTCERETWLSGMCQRCRDKAKAATFPRCAHCGIKPGVRSRGLCGTCYYKPEVRAAHEPVGSPNTDNDDYEGIEDKFVVLPCHRCGAMVPVLDEVASGGVAVVVECVMGCER